MLKLVSLSKLGEIGKERAKRVLLLVAGVGILMGGVKLLAVKGVLSSQSVPFSQEQILDFGAKVVDKAMGVLGKKTEETEKGKGGENGEESDGQVAGAVEEQESGSGKTLEKTVEEKVKEVIETIKNLPEEQAERVKKEVMKEICEDICKIE